MCTRVRHKVNAQRLSIVRHTCPVQNVQCASYREVGGWGRVPFSKKLMSPTPRRKWYFTTGRRAHYMVLDPIPNLSPYIFLGLDPSPPPLLCTGHCVSDNGHCTSYASQWLCLYVIRITVAVDSYKDPHFAGVTHCAPTMSVTRCGHCTCTHAHRHHASV